MPPNAVVALVSSVNALLIRGKGQAWIGFSPFASTFVPLRATRDRFAVHIFCHRVSSTASPPSLPLAETRSRGCFTCRSGFRRIASLLSVAVNKQGAMRTRNTSKSGQTPPTKKASKTPVKAKVTGTKPVIESVEVKQELKVKDAVKDLLEANQEDKKADAKESAKKQKATSSKAADAGKDSSKEVVQSTTGTDTKNLAPVSVKEEPESTIAEGDAENASTDEEMKEAEEENNEELEEGGEEDARIEGGEIDGEEKNEDEEEEDEEGAEEDVDEIEKAYLAEEHPELQEPRPVTERQKRKKLEVFLGGLDKEATTDDVKKAFEGVGEVVEVRLIKDTQTGKNRGYAFVRFASAEHATKAATELKRTQIKGKSCAVVPNEDNDALFLGNINKSWKKEQLLEKLKDYGVGDIEELTLLEDNQNEGMNRGYAFLELATHEEAIKTLKLLAKSGTVFGSDKSARVAWARQSESHEVMMSQVKSVFVDGILPSWTEEKMKALFGKFGEVERIVLARNMPRSKRNDFAFVNFVTRDAAVACIDFLTNNELVDGETKLKVKVRFIKSLPKFRSGKRAFAGGYSSHPFTSAGRDWGGVSRGSIIARKTVRNQRAVTQRGRPPIGHSKATFEILPKFMRQHQVERSRQMGLPRIRRPLGVPDRSSSLSVRGELHRRAVRRDRIGYSRRLVRDNRERDYIREDRLFPRDDFPDILPNRRDRQVQQLPAPLHADVYAHGPERGYDDYGAHDYDEYRPAVRQHYGEFGLGSKRPYSLLEDDIYESGSREFPRARVGYDLPSSSQYESTRSPLGRAGINMTAGGSGPGFLYRSEKQHGYNSSLVGAGDYTSSVTELTGSSPYGSRLSARSGDYGYPGSGSGSYY